MKVLVACEESQEVCVDGIGKEHQSQLNIDRLKGMDWRN